MWIKAPRHGPWEQPGTDHAGTAGPALRDRERAGPRMRFGRHQDRSGALTQVEPSGEARGVPEGSGDTSKPSAPHREDKDRAHAALFEAAGVGMAEAEATTGRLLHVNPAVCSMLGYEAAELLGGMTFGEVTHPEDRTLNYREHQRLLAGKIQHYTIEKRYIRKDGSIIWGRVVATLLRDSEDRPKSSLAVIEDITERKRNEARLELALDVGEVGTWDWDLATDVATCSPSYFRLYGLDPSEGMPSFETWLSRIHPDDRARVARGIELAKRPGRYADEFRVVWPNGQVRWLAARARFEMDSAGDPARMIGVNIDITSQVTGSIDTGTAKALPASYDRQEYADGATIFWQGDPARHCFLIVSGTVKTFKLRPDGKSQILGFRRPGEIIGLFDDGGRYTKCAEALGPVVVRRILASELDVPRPPYQSLQHRLMSNAIRRLIETQDHLALLGNAPARARVVDFLRSLCASVGGTERSAWTIFLPMSREDIADYLSLRRETVSRILKDLRSEGLIELENRSLRIPDPERLREEIEDLT